MTIPTLTYKSSGPGHHVDLDRLIASRCLIQANSGGGKSRAIRQLLEGTHGRVQHLVIDPEGEFATLREHFDYVLAAKSGGDTIAAPAPATPDRSEATLDDRTTVELTSNGRSSGKMTMTEFKQRVENVAGKRRRA